MFNRFRRKDNQPQNVQPQPEPGPVEKQAGFICPMCMAALPGPAELQAHFEKVHNEGGEGEQLLGMEDEVDSLPENNDELLHNISKGSLEIELDTNAPDVEKVVILLQQELSDKQVQLKEEKWYTQQLKTELEKVSSERDKLEDEKILIEKEYMSQLRSAEEGYFEIVEENKKLKEDLVFSDYTVTKERHDKLKQQVITSQNEADEERKSKVILEEDNKLLKEKVISLQSEADKEEAESDAQQQQQVIALNVENKSLRDELSSLQSEMEEETLRREGLETGINMLRGQVTSHRAEATNEKERAKKEREDKEAVENDIKILEDDKVKLEGELHKLKGLIEQEIEKNSSQLSRINELEEGLSKEREKIGVMEKEHAEQLNKMEGGDKESVIQDLSLEKSKLLETVASMESSMTLKLKENSGEIVNIRHEKMNVMVELRECQLEKGKIAEELQSSNQSKEKLALELSEIQKEKEDLMTKLEEFHEEKNKVMLQVHIIEEEREKLREELGDGNEEKEIIMNELRKSQEEGKRLEVVLADHQQEIIACKEESSKLNQKIKDHETSNANLNDLVTKKDNAIKEMKTTHLESVTSLEGEMEVVKQEKVVLEEDLQQSRDDHNLSKEEITKLDAKIVEFEAKNNTLESSLQQKEDILTEVHAKLEVAEQELKKQCDSCKNYEVRLCRLQEETKDSQGVIERLKTEFEDFSSQAEEEKNEINLINIQLEEEKTALHKAATKSIEELAEKQIVIDVLNSEKDLFIQSALQAEERISILDSEMTNLKQHVSNLEDEILSKSAEKEEEARAFEEKENVWISERNLLLEEAEELKLKIEKITTEFQVQEVGWIEEKTSLTEGRNELYANYTKECEVHQITKDNSHKVEENLHADMSDLQRKLELSKDEHRNVMKSKQEIESNFKRIEQNLITRTKEITEYEKKLKIMEHEKDELKGDVSVLEVQLQSSNEEKSALLERVLSTEEQHKKTKQKLSEGNRKLDQALSALQELGQENQNIQVQHVLKSSRQWMQDNECETCKKCDKTFTFTIRKHHCRHCGFIFCSACSGFSAVIASSKKPARVCESCSLELASLRGSNVRRLSNSSSMSSVSNR